MIGHLMEQSNRWAGYEWVPAGVVALADKYGWSPTSTGGGCTALELRVKDRGDLPPVTLLITDGDANIPFCDEEGEPDAQAAERPVVLGWYDDLGDESDCEDFDTLENAMKVAAVKISKFVAERGDEIVESPEQSDD